MILIEGLRAREPRTAARVAAGLSGFSGALMLVWTFLPPWLPPEQLTICAGVGAAMLVVAAALWFGSAERMSRLGLLFAVPVVGSVLVGTANVVSWDASAGGQAFVFLPVLYAATQLRTAGALLATACSVLIGGAATIQVAGWDGGRTDAAVMGATASVVAVVLVHSTARLEQAFAALRREAGSDALTGLLTRRALATQLDAALAREQVGLLMVDVDGFKQVNDTHGHHVGDLALVHLAGVLRSHVRGIDVVGRPGGDELVVVLPGCTAEALSERASLLVEAVRSTPLPLPDGGELQLTISVGAAHAPAGGYDVAALHAAADAALYGAKRAGRNRYALAA